MTVPSLRPSPFVAAVSIALVALVGPTPGWAQDPPRERREAPRHDAPRDRGDRGATPPSRNRDALSDSVRRFERNHRGSRVLSVERMQSDGRDVNRIKAMDDRGRVRVYVDDPNRRQPPPPRRPTRDDHD